MEIEKYLKQIGSLEKLELLQNSELENIVSDVVSKDDLVQFKLEDLFQNQNLNAVLLSKIEQTVNLIFIKEENINVCFANNNEVRPEYKQSFRIIDLLDYMYAFAHSSEYQKLQKIIISLEVKVFWKLVKIGADLRNENASL
ncbi:hypothetical protein [Flavobacterium notoginsengisoli]|uniref:hypothetical protein n=1 Tax=Flavobacterium notoginsengisoli TaxID=1478199 RepID=UPI00364069AD